MRERSSGSTDHSITGSGSGDIVDDIAVVTVEDRAGKPLVRGVRNGGIGCSGVKVKEISIGRGGGGGGGVGRVV